MVRAGRLNRRVTIQRRGIAQDDAGQPVQGDWVDFTHVWADIKHKSGLEAVRSDMPASVVNASIRIRYRTDLDATMRVLYGGVVYGIQAVLPDEAGREFVDLVCQVVPERAE